MSDDFGACIVAIPETVDIPHDVVGGLHVTLAYIGDQTLDNELAKGFLDIARRISVEYTEDLETSFKSLEYFGEDEDAVVLTFDRFESMCLDQLRDIILNSMDSELERYFDSVQTWSEFTPHMTLGYTSEGYSLPSDVEIPEGMRLRSIGFWNGDMRFEFPFERPDHILTPVLLEHAEQIDELRELYHIGTPRHSGRYPWGSGENPNQRNKSFLVIVDELHKKGLSEAEIARGLGISTTQLRAKKAIEKTARAQEQIHQAKLLKERGHSNVAIGERLGIGESQVRRLLDPSTKEKRDILETTANKLKDEVAEKGMIDVGAYVNTHMGISSTKLSTAVAMLKEEGYSVHNIQVDQLGTSSGDKTIVKVLAKPGTTYRDIVTDTSQIKSITSYSEDGGRTFLGIEPPKSVSSKRVAVKYGDEGGADADGVIYLRRDVPDISMGKANYGQVRIAVDGTHYLKGMAIYKDDMPDGVDLLFNTNKKSTGNKLDAMKPLKDDPDNPFGAVISRQNRYEKNGKSELGALNIINEEGDWHKWSKTLSSQMLSKQTTSLAKDQLDLAYKTKKADYDDIMSLTNPTVKRKLLESFADGADASAVHLKAAGLPRTRSHVILPVPSLKPGEIYAPNYRDGERVVLIRHPHGGKFEIPELTVNNKNREGRSTLKNAMDAVGIHPKTASQLSGADFDGDTVLVIPNNSRKVKTQSPLEGLKDFDPQSAYKAYPGMKPITPKGKQKLMGDVSNLITDMSLRGASNSELARAVRHSMVVIDAEKHNLNYKQSEKDHNIKDLRQKYQAKDNGRFGGASTLISKASSDLYVPERKLRSVKDGGPVDPRTGKKVYVETGDSYTNKSGKVVSKKTKTTKMAEADDAFSLASDTPMEAIYATHANRLKALANESRKESISLKDRNYSPTAKKAYASEVARLNAELNLALKNKPLERQAQILANATVSAKRRANPDMGGDELKKIKGQALNEARLRTGAKKHNIAITDRDWEAIQSGAISANKLKQILDNTDLDQVRQLAMPRTTTGVGTAKLNRARNMLTLGYTTAEVADALGVPASTLTTALNEKEG